MKTPKLEELNCSNCTARSMKIHYPEFFDYLVNSYPDLTHSERLYWFYNNIKSKPVCKECGKPVKFVNYKYGYAEFCSNKCVNKSKIIYERKKESNIKKYGENYKQYIYEKTKEGCLKKYGVENVFALDSIKSKIKQTNLISKGVEYPMQSKLVQEKSKQTYLNNFFNENPNIVEILDYKYLCKCTNPKCNKCKEKQFTISKGIYRYRKFYNIELCTKLLPIKNTSTSIENFIRNILDEHSISYETNVRDILRPNEIDIYIPDKNLAIECNGTYWHSTLHKPEQYHHDKLLLCRDKNIQLITIWEDQIINNPFIVESLLLSKLGFFNERIYARQCIIKEIPSNECDEFLILNHLQGKVKSNVRLGLYYNNELLSVMTFGKTRKGIGNDNCTELLRFCNKCGIQIIGGASKLFKYYIKHYNPKEIISYSSNDISDGNLYNVLGFHNIGETKFSYWYIEPNTFQRFHRLQFTKAKLVKDGFDPSLTENEIMMKRGFYKICDTGQQKWKFNNFHFKHF